MNEYGPYRTELAYEVAACMRIAGLEPSERVERTARNVAHLQD